MNLEHDIGVANKDVAEAEQVIGLATLVWGIAYKAFSWLKHHVDTGHAVTAAQVQKQLSKIPKPPKVQ